MDFSGCRRCPAVHWDKRTQLAHERDMLGLYVSDHPLFGIEHVLARNSDTGIAALLEGIRPMGQCAGHHLGLESPARWRSKRNKRGDHATVTIGDLGGAVEVMFFTKTYLACQHLLAMDAVCSVKAGCVGARTACGLTAADFSLPMSPEAPRPGGDLDGRDPRDHPAVES